MNKDNNNPFGFLKTSTVKGQRATEFSTENLFTDNNPQGYFSREQLMEYLSGVTSYQQQKFALFCENLGNGYPITSLPIPMEDEYGNEILWIKFNVNGNRQSFRMASTPWLLNMVKDYNAGKLHGLNFSAQVMAGELKKTNK